jgi:hypothetical protein
VDMTKGKISSFILRFLQNVDFSHISSKNKNFLPSAWFKLQILIKLYDSMNSHM